MRITFLIKLKSPKYFPASNLGRFEIRYNTEKYYNHRTPKSFRWLLKELCWVSRKAFTKESIKAKFRLIALLK